MWVVGSQRVDYKRMLDGNLEYTSKRDQEIEFLREGSATIAIEKTEVICGGSFPRIESKRGQKNV